jgi:hypothetical protein
MIRESIIRQEFGRAAWRSIRNLRDYCAIGNAAAPNVDAVLPKAQDEYSPRRWRIPACHVKDQPD